MEIKKDNKNGLMHRREVLVKIEVEKAPSNAEAVKLIADQFKSSEENIMMEQVMGTFGKQSFLIKASIYDTPKLKEEAVVRLTKAKKTAPAAPAE